MTYEVSTGPLPTHPPFAKGAHLRAGHGPDALTVATAALLCRGCESRRSACWQPIRGSLQAHDAVAPLAQQHTGADSLLLLLRSVCGDPRHPRSR